MVWLPAARAEVEKVALAVVPLTAAGRSAVVSTVVPSRKVTVPPCPGSKPVTVAVNVTDCPSVGLARDDLTPTLVLFAPTVTVASGD